MSKLYDLEVTAIDGKKVKMSDYKGKTLLIVNVASKCGFTPQYTGLGEIYSKYKDRGFVVLGFPCNQFGGQEPGTDTEVAQFCDLNFKVTFPMFSKIDVNGADTNPLFAYLKSAAPGILGTEMIKWNFTKFLVDKSGEVVTRFAPNDTPASIAPKIEAIL